MHLSRIAGNRRFSLSKNEKWRKSRTKCPFWRFNLSSWEVARAFCVASAILCKRVKATVMFSRGRRNAFVLVRYTISWQAQRFGTWRSGCFESQCQGCANKTQVVKSRGRDSILSPKTYFWSCVCREVLQKSVVETCWRKVL